MHLSSINCSFLAFLFFATTSVLLSEDIASEQIKGTRMSNSRNWIGGEEKAHNWRRKMEKRIGIGNREEGKKRSPNAANQKLIRRPFIVKCPRTNKNVSAVVWSHNRTVLFGVNFADGGQLVDVLNESGGDGMAGGQRWRTVDGGLALIFEAKGGRYKIEVEEGSGFGERGRQWFVLKINEMDLGEDSGEWKCQVLANRDGKVRVEAESRKSIGGNDWWTRKKQSGEMSEAVEEFATIDQDGGESTKGEDGEGVMLSRQIRKREQIAAEGAAGRGRNVMRMRGSIINGGRKNRLQASHWEEERRKLFEAETDNTFAFTKTDADFVVFQRTNSEPHQKKHSPDFAEGTVDDAIEYTRSVDPSDKAESSSPTEEEKVEKAWRHIMMRRWSMNGRNGAMAGKRRASTSFLLISGILIIITFVFCRYHFVFSM